MVLLRCSLRFRRSKYVHSRSDRRAVSGRLEEELAVDGIFSVTNELQGDPVLCY